MGGLIVLVVAGFVALRGQLTARRADLQVDLTAHIFEEEAVRAAKEQDRINELIVAEAPLRWRDAYRRIFNDREPYVVDQISLETTDFDGTCALVTVSLDESKQVRNYCLQEQRWRRAPIPRVAWGVQQMALPLSNGGQIFFFERDQTFAKALAADLATFFAQMGRWGLTSAAGELKDINISLQPRELQGPLIGEGPRRIILNSPQLTRSDGVLSGEAAVRLILAERLFARLNQTTLEMVDPPPNAQRFKNAAQSVLTVELLLPADTQVRLFDHWRTQLEGSVGLAVFYSLR